MRDTPPVTPYATPPRAAPKRRDPMSKWFVADALVFIAWAVAYQAVTPLRMTDPPASTGEKMLVRLLLLAACGLFTVLITWWVVRRACRQGRAG